LDRDGRGVGFYNLADRGAARRASRGANETFPLAFVLLLGVMGTTAYLLRRWRYGPAIAAFSVSLLALVVVVAFG
jgi:hypothetical protein